MYFKENLRIRGGPVETKMCFFKKQCYINWLVFIRKVNNKFIIIRKVDFRISLSALHRLDLNLKPIKKFLNRFSA